jgi:hypothetical protein
MNQSSGSLSTPKVECINPRLNKWRIRWNYVSTESTTEDGKTHTNVTFTEEEYTHKPSIDEVKDIILSTINTEIDENIASGFTWNELNVWLSQENQFNYKAAYDLAFQTNGASLPVIFKFGTTDNPQYHTFETIEELSDFYTKAIAYINNTLAEGWQKKDSYDFSEYEEALTDKEENETVNA